MGSRPLILLGAGGHASVVAESAIAAGWDLVGYFADGPTRQVACPALQVPWLGPVGSPNAEGHRWLAAGAKVHAAIGDARIRESWSASFGPDRLATIVHPGAWISPSALVGPGCYVGAFVAVNATASIGGAVILNTGAIIEHGAKVGSAAHCAPRSVLAGMAEAGERALIGAGAVLLPFVKVGADAVVGAGAIVSRDVGAGLTVAGCPAKPLARAGDFASR